jgi:hypothetical protein
VDHKIGRKRHLVVLNLFHDIIEPVVLLRQSVTGKFIEVESPFAITYMVVEPPPERLDFRVPRIYRVIAVTVVAGSLKDRLDGLRYREILSDGG